MRVLLLAIALMFIAGVNATALAGIASFPASYHPRGNDYYENLRTAELAWLRANAAVIASTIAADRVKLAGPGREAKDTTQAAIDRLRKEAGQIDGEIAVMRARRDARQETLLKRHVERWIGAARRSGHGSNAIRLMRDLEGTGL